MSYISDFLSSEEVQASIKSGNDWIYKDWITYPTKDIVVIDYIKIYYFLSTPELDNQIKEQYPNSYPNEYFLHPIFAHKINEYISESVEKRKFIVLKIFYEPMLPEFIHYATKLIHDLGYDQDNCLILAGIGIEVNKLYKTKIIPYHCMNYYNWYNNLFNSNVDFSTIKCTKHFLCLARRASVDRAKLIREMLFNFNKDSIISFAFKEIDSKPAAVIHDKCKNIIRPFSLPILPKNDAKYFHHASPDYYFYECLINLVAESIPSHMHISEKTWKAFAWHQIPIFFGPVKIVHTLKELGFDLFDDILENHYYDNEYDNDKRIMSIIRILKNFKRKYPTTDALNKLRKEIFPRLEKNASLISYYASKESDIFHMCRSTFLDDYT